MGEQLHFKMDGLTNELATLILQAIPQGLFVLDINGSLCYLNSMAMNLLNHELLSQASERGTHLYSKLTPTWTGEPNDFQVADLFFLHRFGLNEVIKKGKTLLGHEVEISEKRYILNATPLLANQKIIGVIALFEEAFVYQTAVKELEHHRIAIQDLQTIFDNSYDVLYVCDGNGVTLRASSACEELWGKRPDELIGRSVYELENEGVYRPSATRLALERKKKVQIVQETKTGRRLMVVSTPIQNSEGEVVRVVNASRDITELHELETELQQLKDIVEGYKIELARLQDQTNQKMGQLIYRSSVMEKIISKLMRIAVVDSTVLIMGESGVGKEVIADYVHSHSPRMDKPLIKVNCAAIPESLLESELFGYEQGAFTGANKNGKAGLFELANDGTLFLDEIGDMPTELQAKLLRVLQDTQIMRIGGRKPIPINVRIIAATNQDLGSRVAQGTFRQDLYYRLNVIPVTIPPLRERKEDILPLIEEFTIRYSTKFNRHIRISKEVLVMLEEYHWPGNIRELQNIVERLIVTTDAAIIGIDHLPEALVYGAKESHSVMSTQFQKSSNKFQQSIEVHKIIPLKKAVYLVETQLLELAKEQCRTVTEMAKVLDMDQSTISRKLQKYGMQYGI